MTKVFPEQASMLTQLTSTATTFVLLKVGSSLYSFPILNFSIGQTVDCRTQKSLKGDVLVSTFGDMPVSIQLQAVQHIGQDRCRWASQTQQDQEKEKEELQLQSVMSLYQNYRASKSTGARAILTLTNRHTGTSTSYICVIVGMTAQPLDQDLPGILSIQISLVGVRR